jgi:hypothetical protein
VMPRLRQLALVPLAVALFAVGTTTAEARPASPAASKSATRTAPRAVATPKPARPLAQAAGRKAH